jgi:hypothetical protein
MFHHFQAHLLLKHLLTGPNLTIFAEVSHKNLQAKSDGDIHKDSWSFHY